jgi:type I restriction enzyme S subunit
MDDNNEKGGVNSTLLPERIPESWEICQILDILERVSNRVDPDKIESQDYISLKHMGKGEPRVRKCGTSDEVSSKKYRFSEGDILFGKLRPYFRKVALSKTEGVCSTDINVIKSTEKVDRDFLFYTLFRQDFINIADKTSTGTRMPRADWKKLDELKIALPSLEEQEKISQILYKIDSKIENNNKISQNLKEIAQTLFKSYFLDFDPYDEFKQTELGRVPEAFEIAEIGELGDIITGNTPSTKNEEYYGGCIPFVKASDLGSRLMISETDKKLTKEGASEISKKQLRKGCVMVSCIGNGLGKVGVTSSALYTNQQINSIDPHKNFDTWYLLFKMQSIQKKLQNYAGGSAQPILSKSKFSNIRIAVPPEKERKKFNERISECMSYYEYVINQNPKLIKMRNNLIPKLMSGEIRVNDIELDDLEADSEV